MNYNLLYETLIETCRSNPPQGYSEMHHIIPRCLGGTDDPGNLVKVSYKNHILAHYYLAKIHNDPKLWSALSYMTYGARDYKLDDSTVELIATINQDLRENYHPIPPNHTNYIWINDGSGRTKRIPRGSEIPDGWSKGRGAKTFGTYERTSEHRALQSALTKHAYENPSDAMLHNNKLYLKGEARKEAMPNWRDSRWGKK